VVAGIRAAAIALAGRDLRMRDRALAIIACHRPGQGLAPPQHSHLLPQRQGRGPLLQRALLRPHRRPAVCTLAAAVQQAAPVKPGERRRGSAATNEGAQSAAGRHEDGRNGGGGRGGHAVERRKRRRAKGAVVVNFIVVHVPGRIPVGRRASKDLEPVDERRVRRFMAFHQAHHHRVPEGRRDRALRRRQHKVIPSE